MRTFCVGDKKGTYVESNRRACSGSKVELEWLAEVQEVLQCLTQEVQEAALRNNYNCSITPLRVWVSLILVHRTRFIISKPKTEIVWIISAQRMRFGLNSQGWHYQKFKIGLSKASKIFQLKHAGKLKTLRVSVIKDVTHVNVILIRPIHVNVDNTDILLSVIMDFSIP